MLLFKLLNVQTFLAHCDNNVQNWLPARYSQLMREWKLLIYLLFFLPLAEFQNKGGSSGVCE